MSDPLTNRDTQAPLSENERAMMLHATGHQRDGRNHYCVEAGADDAKVWRGLIGRGLAEEGRRINDGRDAVFRVTAAGYEALYPATTQAGAEPTDEHVAYMLEFKRRRDLVEDIIRRMTQRFPYTQNVATRIVRWAEDGFKGDP